MVCGGFAELYEKNYAFLYRYILRMTDKNEADAEELTQEVFWIAYQKWELVRRHPNQTGFLVEVAKNRLKKWASRRKREYPDGMAAAKMREAVQVECSGFEAAEWHTSFEQILTREELAVLLQYYGYGYRPAEIARKLGISETCLKARIARMKKRVRNGL